MNVRNITALVILSSGAAFAQAPSEFGPRDAEHRMQQYVQTWEGNEATFAQAVETYYADRVIYYGKSMTRSQVLADKLRFVKSYPQRTYSIAAGTLRTNCKTGICEARAKLNWSRANASRQLESGVSDLRLVLSAADGGRIVRESARTLRTRKEK